MYRLLIVSSILFLTTTFSISCSKESKTEIIANKVKDIENVVNKEVSKKEILSINGNIFYENDFFAFASNVLREMDEESIKNKTIQENLIKEFIEHKLLYAEAKRIGIEENSNEIEKIVVTINSDEGTQDLKAYSGYYNSDPQALSSIIHERRLVEGLLAHVINSNIVVSDKDIRKRYDEVEAKKIPEKKAHIFHIFTKKEDTAKKAYDELQKGISFSEVALRYSDGPEKNHGGDLGFVSENDYPEIFAEAFKLAKNKYSNIIKSDYGYHIFLVKEIINAKKYTYDDVKSKIYFELYSQQQEEKTREFINGLFIKADIKNINNIDFSKYYSK